MPFHRKLKLESLLGDSTTLEDSDADEQSGRSTAGDAKAGTDPVEATKSASVEPEPSATTRSVSVGKSPDKSKGKPMSDYLGAQVQTLTNVVTNGLASFKSQVKGDVENIKSRLGQIEHQLILPSAEPLTRTSSSDESRFCKQVIDELQNGGAESIRRVGRFGFSVKSLFQPLEVKTTITTSTLGQSVPGALVPERVPGIVPLARRQLRLRDLLPVGTTTNDAVEYLKENTFVSACSPQVEADLKGESESTFAVSHAHVTTISHWIPASTQCLDDLPELQRYLTDSLLYQLRLKEETEIISGDGLGVHVAGLATVASAYVGTYVAASDTKIDTLNHAQLEMRTRNEEPDFVIVSPSDWASILLTKTDDGGSNLGSYIMGSPGGPLIETPKIWGMSVIVSNSMSAGSFLMGDSRMCKIYDRMSARVDFSREHSDYFVRNLMAIRCEERVALAVFRTTAFTFGSF